MGLEAGGARCGDELGGAQDERGDPGRAGDAQLRAQADAVLDPIAPAGRAQDRRRLPLPRRRPHQARGDPDRLHPPDRPEARRPQLGRRCLH